MNRRAGISSLAFVFTLLTLLLTGCAIKPPATIPLEEDARPHVLERLQVFQQQECPRFLDVDTTIVWKAYGSTRKIPATLQVAPPNLLRFSVVDPLGRPLVILAGDGETFTLINNREAKALRGSVHASFWRRYLPVLPEQNDYPGWLLGRLPWKDETAADIRREKNDRSTVWLVSPGQDTLRHHVLFDPGSLRVRRRLIEDERGAILLDVLYEKYQNDELGCPIPHRLTVKGAEIDGTIRFLFGTVYPSKTIGENWFHLTIPPHFQLETVR
ncbi:MAG: hypothetical protein Kow0089_10460 [Desulfobulbaceae bacterium]